MNVKIYVIGPRITHLVGDIRRSLSDVLTLRAAGYEVEYYSSVNDINKGNRIYLLKSDNYTSYIKPKDLSTLSFDACVAAKECDVIIFWLEERSPCLFYHLIKINKVLKKYGVKTYLVIVADNLKYINPRVLYYCTRNLTETVKCLAGKLLYNIIYSLMPDLTIAVSRSVRDSLLTKAHIVVLPPTYVEVYISSNEKASGSSNMSSNELLRAILSDISQKHKVLYYKVFGPTKLEYLEDNKPRGYWLLGFMSFLVLYLMALRNQDTEFIIPGASKNTLLHFSRFFARFKELKNVVPVGQVNSQGFINMLYQNSEAVVVIRFGWHGYGVTTSLIEALYFGKPILTDTFAAGSIPHLIDSDVVLVSNDYKFWPELLHELLSSPRLRRSLGRRARRFYDKLLSISKRVRFVRLLSETLLKR